MLPLLLAVLLVTAARMVSCNPNHHPLDPLSAVEFTAVRAAVLASPFVTDRPISFHYVGLDEPDKADVLSYAYSSTSKHPNLNLPRRAFVVARAGGQSHELHVDVTNVSAPSVISHAIHHGAGFPRFTTEELIAAAALPPEYPPFAESVRRRGLDMGDMNCGVLSMGWFGGGSTNGGSRLTKMQCYVLGNETVNLYARPLEGVTLVVDLDKMAIVGYRDRVVYPVPKAEGTDYRADKVGPPFTGPVAAPGVVVQPEGSGVHIDGRVVR
ncbi:unnamed protein product [Urochloa humidicola]